MPRVIDQGICLRHWDWSETSQTVSILTRGHGVVRGLAKGARRERAPFSGGIEIATRGEVVFIPRAGGLATLAAWDLQELFPGVRGSAGGFFIGMYMLDLAQQFVQEGDPHPTVFDTLAACLRELGGGAGTERGRLLPVLRMQWACLAEAGLRPVLDRSAATGEALESAASYGMSAGLGGLVADPGAFPGAGVYRVRAETVEMLRRLEGGELVAAEDEAVMERAARLLAVYVHHVLGKALPTAEALFGREAR